MKLRKNNRVERNCVHAEQDVDYHSELACSWHLLLDSFNVSSLIIGWLWLLRASQAFQCPDAQRPVRAAGVQTIYHHLHRLQIIYIIYLHRE